MRERERGGDSECVCWVGMRLLLERGKREYFELADGDVLLALHSVVQ